MAPIDTSSFGVDNYVPLPFVNTNPIKDMHHAPRGGHSNNITRVIEGRNGEDYLVGVLFLSIVIMSFFAFWSLVLVVFKCLGPNKVGWLSGKPPVIPAPPPGYDLELEEEDDNRLQNKDPSLCESTSSSFEDSVKDKEIAIDHGVPCEESEMQLPEPAQNENDNSSSMLDEPEAIINETCCDLSTFVSARSMIEYKESDVGSNADKESGRVEDKEEIASTSFVSARSNTSSKENDDNGPADSNMAMATGTGFQESDSEALDNWRIEANRIRCLYRNGRAVVILSCLFILTASGLYLGYGIHSLVNSLDNAITSLDLVDSIALRGIGIIDNFVEAQAQVQIDTERFLQNASDFCPDLNQEDAVEICKEVVDGLSNVTNSSTVCRLGTIQETLEAIASSYDEFKEVVVIEVDAVRSDLYEILEITDEISKVANQFNWAFYISAAFAAVYDIGVILLMYGVIRAWRGTLSWACLCFRRAIIIPAFLFCLVLVWIFASVFVIGSLASADFCYNSPDGNVNIILQHNRDRFGSNLVFDLLEYYINGCMGQGVIQSILDGIDGAFTLLELVHRLLTLVGQADVNELSKFCGTNMLPFVLAANVLDADLHILVFTINDVRELFFCENWYPIYSSIGHDAMCYNGVTGFSWIYSSFLAAAFCSMIIVTVRFATFNMIKEEGISVAQEKHQPPNDDAQDPMSSS